MITALVLSRTMIAQYLSTFVCPGCRRTDRPHQVFYPRYTRRENEIELRYDMQCACGKCARLQVRLPILLLGYLMVSHEMLQADMGGDATCSWMTVEPATDKELLIQRTHEYWEIMRQLPTGLEPPSAADRSGLELDEQGWRDFLKRMQLGTDGVADASASAD
jgi:hypothetical protein